MRWNSPTTLFLPSPRAAVSLSALRDSLPAAQHTHLVCPTPPVAAASLTLRTPVTGGPPPSRRAIVSHSAGFRAPSDSCNTTCLTVAYTHTAILSRKSRSRGNWAHSKAVPRPYHRNSLAARRPPPAAPGTGQLPVSFHVSIHLSSEGAVGLLAPLLAPRLGELRGTGNQ